jgi:O-acetyl-ADP-ribose deacetylase (regulator of RNase III)
MEISVVQQDLFELSGDALICPANAQLNMSGGINGELLRRGGADIQAELRTLMASEGVRSLAPGTIVITGAGCFPFQKIVHAVAIDAFYDTTIDIVAATIIRAWNRASELGLRKVVMPMLGTGYGRLPTVDFAQSLTRAVAECRHLPITVTLAVRDVETSNVLSREITACPPSKNI